MVDRPATECEVDEDEIEVTPEMIEAGVRRFCEYDPRFEEICEVLPEVFREMAKANKDYYRHLSDLSESSRLRQRARRTGEGITL